MTLSRWIRIASIVASTSVMSSCSEPLKCLPNSVQSCFCKNGQAGTQLCDPSGKIVGPCGCDDQDGGIVNRDGMTADTNTGPDVQRHDVLPPDPQCGDGRCDTNEACNSCPSDCGRCPPICGDGQCNGNESCSSCAADCRLCACQSCISNEQCASGLYCAQRSCDGRRGCAMTGGGMQCDEIAGQPCPQSTSYRPCQSSQECGPNQDCMSTGPNTVMQCSDRCATDANCSAPAGSGTFGACGFAPGVATGHCFLICNSNSVCPVPLVCRPYAPGMAACG
jgi:hypothetical protein